MLSSFDLLIDDSSDVSALLQAIFNNFDT